MAGLAPSDKVKDKEYSNWLKVTLALYYMKSGLHTFMQSEIDCLHQSLVQKTYGGKTVPQPPCTICHASHVQFRKEYRAWTFPNQCQSYCDVWFYELLALHTNPKSEKIYWNNCHVASWPFKPWECAKVFMPNGQLPSNVGPAECDAQALLTMLANCTHFHQKLSPQGLGLTHSISSIRNKVMYHCEMKLSDADRLTFIKQIIHLLEDPVSLKSIEDCKAAVGNIRKFNNDSLDASFSLDLEMTCLKSAINEIRFEHGMQKERLLDTVDSLKVVYKQLLEQIRKKVMYVDDRMVTTEIKGYTIEGLVQLVKGHTALADQQDGKQHQEIAASHGVRLHKPEDNMPSFWTEMQDLKVNKVTKMGNTTDRARKTDGEGISLYSTSETPIKRRSETDRLRQLKSQTEDTLDSFRRLECIPTTQREEARKLLDKKRYVLIKGNPGEGKTIVALCLIDKEIYRDRRVVVYSPRDWKTIDTDWVDIAVLEDIFGQFDLDPDRLKEWMVYLPAILEYVEAGKLQVIITTRSDILSKAHSMLGSLRLFSNSVSLTLSLEKLNNSEKMSMLNRELRRHKRKINENEKKQCILNFKGLLGFPQCCSLFAGNRNLFDRGSEFFKSPWTFYMENMSKLEETQFLSLAFLFCNGKISENYLTLESMPESSKILLKELLFCLQISEQNTSVTLLRDVYERLWGLYVVKSSFFEFSSVSSVLKPSIRFSHAVVCEAVGHVLGDHPQVLVKYGNSEFLYQKTYTAKSKDITSKNVFIPESVYGFMAERMIHDVAVEGLKESVVKHSAFKQHSFVMKLKDELHKSNRIRDFFSDKLQFYRHLDLIEGECVTILQYFLRSDEDVATLVHSELLEFLACTHDNNRTYCWQCKEKQMLLELALYYHHFEIADKLIAMNACYTYTSLCNAARHGDLSRVQSILEMLKRSQVFSPVCDVAKDALCRAFISGHQGVTEFLLQEGIILDERHLIYVVKKGNMNVLIKVIEHLKSHNNWNPHLEKYWRHRDFFSPSRYSGKGEPHEVGTFPYSTALYIAYCNEAFDMACQLVKHGAILSMEMLPGVLRYSSKKAVSQLIKILKDIGIWDSNHCDAIAALQISYTQQKYDVCDLLIQFGVSLRMKSVPGVIVHQRELFAKRVIQHLKDTKNWEPKCHFAYKALENAYSQGAYDVCDLLVKEGVSIIMKHLPLVILRPSEYVKMAITKLKDSTCWDPKCDYAVIALEHAYSERKYDVCNLLIQEGVSLTMKNLPNVICHYKASLQSVQKVIEHLKDTINWDPNSVYAAEALQHAYSRWTCDVCDLLILEGVPLTMKSFPYMASLDCVKKAIQQLKDSDNWDPKCDYASRALQYACRHQNDLYDLLIQEGVSLSMDTFLDLICNKEASVHSVIKTINILKDISKWDPKCDDASEAVTYAYLKEKYDVCDALIQEGVSLTMKNLAFVVNRDEASFGSVKKTIQHLKDTYNWDPKCNHASVALAFTYVRENYDACNLLVQEGVSLTMGNFVIVVQNKTLFGSVKKTIQHLKDYENWDPKCDHASVALAIAYVKEKYDVCNLLLEEGISLTMGNLAIVLQNRSSFQSVKKTVYHLKDVQNWDPKCTHASIALAIAYVKEKYDVCDLLVQEGVSLKMGNFAFIVDKNETSLESLKETIQHLKDTDNWDPKCDDASMALLNAYVKEKYDVCDLLVQGGFSLTMRHLAICVQNRLSVKSVKKTVHHLKDTDVCDPEFNYASVASAIAYVNENYDLSQLLNQEEVSQPMQQEKTLFEYVNKTMKHLKDIDAWKPYCEDASLALKLAYVREKYDVCDLLVDEGVSLKMRNLDYFVEQDKTSFESFKKIIQHLKYTDNWNPKCNDASRALAIAYVKKKHEMCDLLLHEGVSLTMGYLYFVICCNETSFESVKNTIQHLKDTYNWYPKWETASLALAIAYVKERYDVCDLLIQERVSLTTKNVAFIVQKNISFDYVKKIIQHLKDTDNWDPECDHASRALANAYVKEKYDICDLLVQEGVSLTIEDLAIVVQTKISFDSVQNIIQHLIDTDNWDPKCDDASIVLAIAYIIEKYDVCDLLIQEGVSLTMGHLDMFVKNKTSVQSVKTAIQHLKDTGNWNPRCDEAKKTLIDAFTQRRFHVCYLLLVEGVKPTMKHLFIKFCAFVSWFESLSRI